MWHWLLCVLHGYCVSHQYLNSLELLSCEIWTPRCLKQTFSFTHCELWHLVLYQICLHLRDLNFQNWLQHIWFKVTLEIMSFMVNVGCGRIQTRYILLLHLIFCYSPFLLKTWPLFLMCHFMGFMKMKRNKNPCSPGAFQWTTRFAL